MQTDKLFQKNVYLTECDAVVLDSFIKNDKKIIILDKTVFFPEGGGQSCDLGKIDKFAVNYVFEDGEVVCHEIESDGDNIPQKGDAVHCTINWDRRFDNMQRHCGEHILSGVIAQEFGGVNRGFHMGDEYMTIDINLEENPEFTKFTWEMARHAELLANKTVWSNAPVITRYYDKKEDAAGLPLRKKLTIDENISIVCVGDIENPYDCVACCGTHPATAGQVGLIKLFKVEPNKGMFRIFFEAGQRALLDFEKKHDIITSLGRKYSAGPDDLMEKIDKQDEKTAEMRNNYFTLRNAVITRKAVEIAADTQDSDAPVHCYAFPELLGDDLRNIGKHLSETDFKGLVVLKDEAQSMALLFSNGTPDCGKLVKDNAPAFSGKGGGRNTKAQAKFGNSENMNLFCTALGTLLK